MPPRKTSKSLEYALLWAVTQLFGHTPGKRKHFNMSVYDKDIYVCIFVFIFDCPYSRKMIYLYSFGCFLICGSIGYVLVCDRGGCLPVGPEPKSVSSAALRLISFEKGSH